MKCQLKYHWVKLPRACLPQGKGVLGQWARLAARAAYRKGVGLYCGFQNPVEPGMWAGGVVGLKSILGAKSRTAALESLERLQTLGYVSYSLDRRTKKLVYTVLDRVVTCTGEACLGQGVYAYEGQGFLCVPRTLPDRLAKRHYIFEEADALLDLWCHTVWQEPRNLFSHLAPAVQYGSMATVLTLETLGKRWGWEKTKVWRFFKTRGCLPSVPTARFLRLLGVQRPISHETVRGWQEICSPYAGGNSAHNRKNAFLRWKYA